MKPLDTNFTYAILAIIFIGFLLWHSIAIFTLQQELENLQNTTVIPVKAGIQKNGMQDSENVDTQILYNEDGSIDTSNWKTYTNEEYGFSVKYPEGWDVQQSSNPSSKNEIIVNISDKHENDRPGLSIIPRGGFDYGWSKPIQRTVGEFGGRSAEFWLFEYATYPTQIRIQDYPENWNESNRVEIRNSTDAEIVDKVIEEFLFL